MELNWGPLDHLTIFLSLIQFCSLLRNPPRNDTILVIQSTIIKYALIITWFHSTLTHSWMFSNNKHAISRSTLISDKDIKVKRGQTKNDQERTAAPLRDPIRIYMRFIFIYFCERGSLSAFCGG